MNVSGYWVVQDPPRPQLFRYCAWCAQERGRQPIVPKGVRITHGICERHRAQLMAEAREKGRPGIASLAA